MNLAWHFVALEDGKPVLRDGRPLPAVGEWLVESPPIKICKKGLHASWNVLDALSYRPWGSLVACLVEVDDILEEMSDKLVCSRRRIVGMVECDDILLLFAREAALSVIPVSYTHLRAHET